MKRYWHYTTGQRFRDIAREGVIRPATAYVAESEQAAVWFSTLEPWEPTTAKALPNGRLLLTMEENAQHAGGLVRIAVGPETARYNWLAYKNKSGIPKGVARALAKIAVDAGSHPRYWWVSFEPVPRARWTAVEVWHDGAWVDVPFTP